MQIYEIKFDVNNFKHLSVDTRRAKSDEQFLRESAQFNCHGVPKENWVPPVVYAPEPKLPEPDIWCAGSGGFAIKRDALESFEAMLDQSGQLLPFEFKGQPFLLCNILQKAALSQTEFDLKKARTMKMELRGRSLDMDAIRLNMVLNAATPPNASLFKIPMNYFRSGILCAERTGDTKTEFRACVLANNMQGISFNLVWEG